MKVFSRALLAVLSTACLATFATAQTIPVGTFKHIIIIVQENRTPDNLFGYWANTPCTVSEVFNEGQISPYCTGNCSSRPSVSGAECQI